MKPLLPAIFLLACLGALANPARAQSGEVFVRKVQEFSDHTALMVDFRGRIGIFHALSIRRPAGQSDAEWKIFVDDIRALGGRRARLDLTHSGPIRGGCMLISGDAVHFTPLSPPLTTSGVAGNTILSESPSPDGRFKAVVFRRDSGTTPGLTTQVSLLPATETLPNAPGNIFIAPYDLDYRPHWNSAKSPDLIISGEIPAPGDAILALREFRGVRIFYRDEIKTEAARIRITSVEPSGAVMLTVRFDGAWTLPPPASSSQIPRKIPQPAQNAVIFQAYTPEEKTALADLATRFRAVQDQTVSFTILHPGGQIKFLDDTPMLSLSGLTAAIEE